MRYVRLQITATLFSLFCATVAHAQQTQPGAAVPKLVRFSGSFRPADGTPAQTMESVTLSVYRDQAGGNALWHEIQNVVVDADGRYSVLMGATQNQGMPMELFTSGEPRWFGAQFNRPGEGEQPRVLLVSVPYALKAADAETLGGKPASAFLLAAPTVGADTARETTSTTTAVKPKANPANSGLPNYIGKFANSTDLIDSAMYEVNGNVGIFTKAPAISLDVRTGALPQMGIAGTVDYLTFFASDQYGPAIYWDPAKDMRFGKGGSGLYSATGFVEQMRIKSSNGNVGIGTQTPGSKLDVAGDVNFSGSVLYQGSPVLQLPGGVSKQNTATGHSALVGNTTGVANTAMGNSALTGNTTGQFNTATGNAALASNTTGSNNTATGNGALLLTTTGLGNTATGAQALFANSTGNYSTATGYQALFANSTGSGNTATGYQALFANTTGNNNTANGYSALLSNTTGSGNTAFGTTTLMANTTGSRNTAFGEQVLNNNTGDGNTAFGYLSLNANTTGGSNTAIGTEALTYNVSGSNNIALGSLAAASVSAGNSNNIHIGNSGSAGDVNTIRIGDPSIHQAFFAAGVWGSHGNGDSTQVYVDSNGQLGIQISSRRFKEDIADMGAASRDLMRLRPVTFRYKQAFHDGAKPIQYGLIAEEVNEVYPDLVAHSADGQIETVKYQVLDSMLLNEVQRQQAKVQRLEQKIDEQRQQNRSLEARLADLETALSSTTCVSGPGHP